MNLRITVKSFPCTLTTRGAVIRLACHMHRTGDAGEFDTALAFANKIDAARKAAGGELSTLEASRLAAA